MTLAEMIFQSTLPARGATTSPCASATGSRHFNPRSPHGERLVGRQVRDGRHRISIHAPRTGSDTNDFVTFLCVYDISIHAPRTGSDGKSRKSGAKGRISIHAPRTGSDDGYYCEVAPTGTFQSTLPARGATRSVSRRAARKTFQSTLPARGATQSKRTRHFASTFQSTLPARGATRRRGAACQLGDISIHAPRTGSDTPRARC